MADHEGAKDNLSHLSNVAYDTLKNAVTIVLPGIGAAYFGLAQIWMFPEPEKVVGTITVLTVFLGLFLKLEKSRYDASPTKYDGTMTVDTSVNGALRLSGLEPHGTSVAELLEKDEVLLKVKPEDGSGDPDPRTAASQ